MIEQDPVKYNYLLSLYEEMTEVYEIEKLEEDIKQKVRQLVLQIIISKFKKSFGVTP